MKLLGISFFTSVFLLMSSYAHAVVPADCLQDLVLKSPLSQADAMSCSTTCQALISDARPPATATCLAIELFQQHVSSGDPCTWIVSEAFIRPFDDGETELLKACVANHQPAPAPQNPLIGPFD
jgi:hypothetical protein